MTRVFSAALLLALSLAAVPAPAADPPARRDGAANATADSKTDAAFKAIYEKEWAWRQQHDGGADEDSDGGKLNPKLPDVSAAAQQERLRVWDEVLRQLDALDPQRLSAANQVNLAVYREQVHNLAENVRLRSYEMPFNSDSSFWSNLNFMARRSMANADEYRAYIAQLNDVPRHFDQQIDNMRAGLARGFSVPRAVLDGREGSIAAVATLKDPTAAALYAPFKSMPAKIPAAEQQALREAAQAAITGSVIPAVARL